MNEDNEGNKQTKKKQEVIERHLRTHSIRKLVIPQDWRVREGLGNHSWGDLKLSGLILSGRYKYPNFSLFPPFNLLLMPPLDQTPQEARGQPLQLSLLGKLTGQRWVLNGMAGSRVEGGKPGTASTMASLFGNLCLLVSQSHPLPSFLDLRCSQLS